MTAAAALPLDEDLPPLAAALHALGAVVATPAWDDPRVDWSEFDVALLRSTWDYVDRIDEFLAWVRRCADATRLENPAGVVAWNTDKHYLAQLHGRGVAVVPTRFVESGAPVTDELDAFLAPDAKAFTVGAPCTFDEFVVKPSIGAGSRDAARYRRAERDRAQAHLGRLVRGGSRGAMLQPYLPSVDALGETAVVYLEGQPSHAIRKGPLLRPGDALVEGLFATEQITPRVAGADEAALAAAAFAALPFAPPLYARIDLIRAASGEPLVLELELTEPSLFFLHAPGSAGRLARALLARLAAPASRPAG